MGATGARITGKAAELLARENKKFEVCDFIKDLSSSYEILVGKNL